MLYKSVTRVIQYFCFPKRPTKGGDNFHLQKGGESSKRGGVDLEKEGMIPFTNYELLRFFTSYIQSAFLPVTVFFILLVR